MVPSLSNLLLEQLPESYRKTLALQAIAMPVGSPLYAPGEVPHYAHFITSGIASIVSTMEDGEYVEVGLMGSESLVECIHLLGPATTTNQCMVQVEATALRMPLRDLQKEFQANEPLRRLVLRCVQSEQMILSKLAACNRLHTAEERLARWLLMVQDRIGGETILLTQEFLAAMLGARRTTVTLAAGALQRSGLIEYRRGRIRILDRESLENAACECYGEVRDLLKKMYR